MSVTISAVPVYFLASLAISALTSKGVLGNLATSSDSSKINNEQIAHLSQETIEELQEKEFETPFVDRDTLVKTLNEHGGEIEKEMIGYIKYKLENFTFEFYKENQEAECPYKLKMKYIEDSSLNEILDGIKSEYEFNTQEASYNKITKRLQEKNLHYEEEVYDDDSIVITVNLD